MAETGQVILVGAGPGNPGLLTLAGKSALEQADVVLHDRLVGEEILDMLPSRAEKIDVGKTKGRHPIPQDEINRLLLKYAREGKTVVRLKGGDPYLFGRGAEELEQIAEAGIPFRVVPGVTSAVAVPAWAGIPVTHRQFASSLHIFTGHGKDGNPPDIPYRTLAGLGGTLVFLMGLSAVADLCRNLVAAGMPENTPAALIENGTLAVQRTVSGTLATLPGLAETEAVVSPAILAVGSVCRLAETFDWTRRRPLQGVKLLVASSRSTGGRLAALLRDRGAAVDEFAGIRTERLPLPDAFWETVKQYGWIVFTSETGVECFFDGFFGSGGDVRSLAAARFAVVGPRTGQALARHGIHADFMPGEYNGKVLGNELRRLAAPGDAVLLYRAEYGGDELPDALREGGMACTDIAAYRTIANAMKDSVREKAETGRYDAVTFTSASAVDAFMAAAPQECVSALPAYCIGETTAAAARRHGMRAEVAKEATIESMVSHIVEKEKAEKS